MRLAFVLPIPPFGNYDSPRAHIPLQKPCPVTICSTPASDTWTLQHSGDDGIFIANTKCSRVCILLVTASQLGLGHGGSASAKEGWRASQAPFLAQAMERNFGLERPVARITGNQKTR